MSDQAKFSTAEVDVFCEDITKMAYRTAEEIFSLSNEEVKRLQLNTLRRRFSELGPKLNAVQQLIDLNKITQISEINDIVPLLLPHTACKSYPLSLIDNCRFEHLNEWLNDYTSFDLSSLDVAGCQSLDEWLQVVEKQTPVRVITSSGSSGKLSIIPRSMVENKMIPAYFYAFYTPFRDEPGFKDPFSEGVYHVSPQLSSGRHSSALATRYIIEFAYNGDASHYLTPTGENSTDLLWMTGRMRKAQADGTVEKLKKTKAWKRLGARVEELSAKRAANLEEFYCDMLKEMKGKTVALRMGPPFMRDMVLAAEKHGIDIDFAPDSFVTAAGGMKGAAALTEEENEKIRKAIPFPLNDVYACSELYGGLARKCSQGHYHSPPWLVGFVLDPNTGVPYPRAGTQTGRYAGFDLWAQTYWGGYITGDEVTINWDGGCDCGREGPYMHNTITRYTDKNGDDKITCQRTAAAVEEMMQHLQNQ